MTQPLPSFHEVLAALFGRHGLDRHRFFEQPEPVIETCIDAGNEALDMDDFELAEQAYLDALHLSQAARLPLLEAAARNRLSGVMDMQGRPLEALSFLEEALEIYRTQGHLRGQVVCLGNMGGIKASLNQFDSALELLRAALDLARDTDDEKLTAGILINIGLNCYEGQLYEAAVAYFREARAYSQRLGNHELMASCLINEGDALIGLEHYAEAHSILDAAFELTRQHEIRHLNVLAGASLGQYHEQVSEWQLAVGYHLQARELAHSIGYVEGQLNAVLNLGRVNVDHGNPVQAAEQLHEALRLATTLERPASRRDAHRHLARLYRQSGQPGLALDHFEAFYTEEQALLSTERDKTTRTLMMQFDVERAQTQAQAERGQREHAERLQAQAEAQVRERTADLEQAQMEVVNRLAMAAEFRDDATGEHTRRVGIGAALIAEALGLSREFTETLQIAARLHDVGKIGIPDAVLLKAGRLSVSEFEEMKRHTLIGARLLSGGKSEVLNMARQIALTHHERWDGNGYPHGLTGQEIPLVGRIVALADVFDALMHKRPYKSAWDKSEVMAELARQRGRHFDPELTDAALLVFGSGRYETALLSEYRTAAPTLSSSPADVAHWELEAMRLQYEQLLESRTRELEAARYQAEVQVEQLRRAAFTDVLTGLHNRRAFETDLLAFAEQAQQSGRPVAVISLDLDGLKHINDSGGHASGDALICSVARQLQQHFEPSGRVYRMGGDKYAVLLWSDPETVASQLAGDIRQLEAELKRQGHAASLSVGSAHWPHDTAQPEELLRLSDERMYQQKRQRKYRERRVPVAELS